MDKKQIEDYFERCCIEHGPEGDRSMEYIGLIFDEGCFRGIKEYRILSGTTDEEELSSDQKDNELFKIIVRYARIYDFSKRVGSDGEEYSRIVFAPFKSVLSSEELFDELLGKCGLDPHKKVLGSLMKYYGEKEFTGHSPLLKMGLEFTKDMRIRESKVYLALRSYDDKNDTIGRRYSYSECAHLIDKTLSLLGMEQSAGEFREISAKMENLGYYPVFSGINFSDEYSEMKVYYETVLPSYSQDSMLKAENGLFALMSNDAEWWNSFNLSMIGKDLFADCVSYSTIGSHENGKMTVRGNVWKPYYLFVTPALEKNRQIDRYCYERKPEEAMDHEAYRSVLLVDEQDVPLGIMPKMEAHRSGILHRAFSVFLYDDDGKIILQKRAMGKYHSPGLWTNTCCSHPFTDLIREEAELRLQEELGITCTGLEEIFTFIYRAEVGNGLTEHEFDHVLAGKAEGEIVLNKDEADEIRAVSVRELEESLKREPEAYTEWFKIAFPGVRDYLLERGIASEDRR